VKQHLIPFLPNRAGQIGGQWVWNYDLAQSIGRVRAFSEYWRCIPARAYIMCARATAAPATMDAVLTPTTFARIDDD